MYKRQSPNDGLHYIGDASSTTTQTVDYEIDLTDYTDSTTGLGGSDGDLDFNEIIIVLLSTATGDFPSGEFIETEWRVSQGYTGDGKDGFGELAAYTPRGIASDKWYNETQLNKSNANSNHGTPTGATVVGLQRFGNTYSFSDVFTVKGAARIGADAGGVAIWSDGNDGFVKGLDALGNSYNNLYLGGQANALKITTHATTPAVEATSGTSGNLKQVARVHSEDIEGTGSRTRFAITHNLGTEYINVSVFQKDNAGGSGNRTQVECLIHVGEYYSQGSSAWDNSTNNNHCEIEFATAPADGVEFGVTVIG